MHSFKLDQSFIEALDRLWSLSSVPAALIHEGGKILWSNSAAFSRGWEPGLFLEELDEDGGRLSLASGLAFSSGAGRPLRTGEDLFYGQILADRPDLMLCLSFGVEDAALPAGGSRDRGFTECLPFVTGALDTSVFEKYSGQNFKTGSAPAAGSDETPGGGGREGRNFLAALAHTLEFEGGYANDPHDGGGETFRGISRKNWPGWAGWPLIDQAKTELGQVAAAINKKFSSDAHMDRLVGDFYYQNFWRLYENLSLPGRTTAKIFDTAVNMGPKRASVFLQSILNEQGASPKIAEDGALGPGTRNACRQVPVHDVEEYFSTLTAAAKPIFIRP